MHAAGTVKASQVTHTFWRRPVKLSAVNKGRFLPNEHKSLPADLAPDIRFEIRDGDFLLTRSNTPELVGDVCVAREVRRGLMLCDLVYRLQLRSEPVAPAYLAYWLLSRAGRHQIEVDARGSSQSMVKISQGLIRSWTVVLPPLAEQNPIVAFLDRETARIDALVAKKERLIELLQEKRTALITQAVTKGLDPNVPMKDSGVEWLGEIPAHWTAKHLRWAIMFQRGHDLPTDEREDGQVPVVSSSGISSVHSRAVAKAPGIVTGRYGTIGHFHLITQDYWPLNTTLYSIDMRGNDPRFLRYMLDHLSPLFLLNAVKSAVPGVDRNDIHPTRTAVPPLAEQRSIADFLDARSAEVDGLVAKVRNAMERLKELRTALISAAVAGKIDVREEAA